jgi:hypothetical protein
MIFARRFARRAALPALPAGPRRAIVVGRQPGHDATTTTRPARTPDHPGRRRALQAAGPADRPTGPGNQASRPAYHQ